MVKLRFISVTTEYRTTGGQGLIVTFGGIIDFGEGVSMGPEGCFELSRWR
jgi:hypothetical protein